WFGTVLDLGCGTGLAGAAIRPVCDWIVGIDLSSAMIAEAHRKGLYDRLDIADAAVFMAAERQAASGYHLILAADVLPYIGDLGPILAMAASMLCEGALFGFSVETHVGEGVMLGDKLRYHHGEAHVRTAIDAAGLVLVSLAYAPIRNE